MLKILCDDLLNFYKFKSQVSAWKSATLLPIGCKSVQPVPARVEEPVSPVRHSLLVVVSRTIHPFPGCLKLAEVINLSKLALVPVRNPPQAEIANIKRDSVIFVIFGLR